MPIRSRLASRLFGILDDLVEVLAQRVTGYPFGYVEGDRQCGDVHTQLRPSAVEFGDVFRCHGDLGDLNGVIPDLADLAKRFERSDLGDAVFQHHCLNADLRHEVSFRCVSVLRNRLMDGDVWDVAWSPRDANECCR